MSPFQTDTSPVTQTGDMEENTFVPALADRKTNMSVLYKAIHTSYWFFAFLPAGQFSCFLNFVTSAAFR